MEGGWMRGTEQKIATLMRKLKSAVVKKNMNANKMEIFHRQNKLLEGKKNPVDKTSVLQYRP